MRKLVPGLAAAVTATVAALSFGGPATAATSWTIDPSCATVTGPASLTYTKNAGATLTPTTVHGAPITYTSGLTALDSANTLLSVQAVTASGTTTRTVYRSTDAGCTWTAIGTLPTGQTVKATAGKGGYGYLWSQPGGTGVYRVAGTTVTQVTDPTVTEPATDGSQGFAGFGTDPANGLHVFASRTDGQVLESADGGVTWAKRGTPIATDLVYQVSFDPANPLHAVAGSARDGVFTTFDGGLNWARYSNIDQTNHPGSAYGVNVFRVAISPANPNLVWATGLDLSQMTADTDQGRHVYRSLDGGRTFEPLIHHNDTPGVFLTNSIPLYPHATDPSVVYFAYGDNYLGYGTDVWKYNGVTGELVKTHNPFHGLEAVAFSPVNPSTVYFGLAIEP
ncbi:WD40/YVTN/BNR-like repeat-containing protein [Longispora albida]|uniref:WD40/YVTN/BNR-like repeat-containing protein n=1 Tax=Longispora albida TaxID=203523 RepID=UPI000377C976|nr:hypothetical protein [Longispora albida]